MKYPVLHINMFFKPPPLMGVEVSMFDFLLQIRWNIQIWREKLCLPNPIPLGWRGDGVYFQKHHFARNWMTSRYVQKSHPILMWVEEGQFTKIICLLGFEWKSNSVHNTYIHQSLPVMKVGIRFNLLKHCVLGIAYYIQNYCCKGWF